MANKYISVNDSESVQIKIENLIERYIKLPIVFRGKDLQTLIAIIKL